MDRIPESAIANIQRYFHENLSNYEVVKVRRKSWHEDDTHLFMVAAKKNTVHMQSGAVEMNRPNH